MTLSRKLPYNLICIIIAQAIAMIIIIMFYSFAPIVGKTLFSDPKYANLPIAISLLAMVCSTIPFGRLSQSKGRQPVFIMGNLAVITSGILFYLALSQHSVVLFCLGGIGLGISSAAMSFYRFAAMEIMPTEQQSMAISAVMLVGVIAAFIAPNLAIFTRNLFNTEFAASFLLMVPLGVIALIFIAQVSWPEKTKKPLSTSSESENKNSVHSVNNKVDWTALKFPIIVATLAYFVMTLLMNATPLHMHNHHYSFSDTAWIMQWHMLGMFAPSIITGLLINKYGLNTLISFGAWLLLLSISINILSTSTLLLTISLTLLGIGWNFTFIGASQLLVTASTGQAQAKIQGINDFIIFGFSIFASIGSSWLLISSDWQTINQLIIIMPILIIILSMKNKNESSK